MSTLQQEIAQLRNRKTLSTKDRYRLGQLLHKLDLAEGSAKLVYQGPGSEGFENVMIVVDLVEQLKLANKATKPTKSASLGGTSSAVKVKKEKTAAAKATSEEDEEDEAAAEKPVSKRRAPARLSGGAAEKVVVKETGATRVKRERKSTSTPAKKRAEESDTEEEEEEESETEEEEEELPKTRRRVGARKSAVSSPPSHPAKSTPGSTKKTAARATPASATKTTKDKTAAAAAATVAEESAGRKSTKKSKTASTDDERSNKPSGRGQPTSPDSKAPPTPFTYLTMPKLTELNPTFRIQFADVKKRMGKIEKYIRNMDQDERFHLMSSQEQFQATQSSTERQKKLTFWEKLTTNTIKAETKQQGSKFKPEDMELIRQTIHGMRDFDERYGILTEN
ncbi:hypothetical protein GQ42DRAFT_163081 [Ramicandelaber brevisporus]|nr:hypothetical protein GQ42DRAFT_163081 [Ramicandelaber brevisporus]